MSPADPKYPFAARTLRELSQSLRAEPLRTPEELEKFYAEEVNAARGSKARGTLRLNLEDAIDSGLPYRTFVYGHQGTGKSTELAKLEMDLAASYVPVRFSVTRELNPTSFSVDQVLTLMAVRVIERLKTILPAGEWEADQAKDVLRQLFEHLADEQVTEIRTDERAAVVEGGLTLPKLFGETTGLIARFTGQARVARSRKTEARQFQLDLVSRTTELANRIFDFATERFREREKKAFVLIGEDFDKRNVPEAVLEEVFIANSALFDGLRANMILTLPIEFVHGQRSNSLPFRASGQYQHVFDIPVYEKGHGAHEAGRQALRSLLARRVSLDLFEPGQLDRLLVASGGNLQDLFRLALAAASDARIRGAERIGAEDTEAAIRKARYDLRRTLEFDSVGARVALLKELYLEKPLAEGQEKLTHELLQIKAVQEFNGEGRYAVHPLVVDVLTELDLRDARNHKVTMPAPGGSI